MSKTVILGAIVLGAVSLTTYAAFVGMALARLGRKALYLLALPPLALIVGMLVVEILGGAYAYWYRAHDVLFLEPHPVVGWKLVPNLSFVWAGHHWYSREFAVRVSTNAHGFRDSQRSVEKPKGMLRVAVLGDSMIEALQVELDKTATKRLERSLNERYPRSAARWEVLNFGVSNYGIGQSLLLWQSDVKNFTPDYVFVLVADYLAARTVSRYESGAFPRTRQRQLWLRPTFELSVGRLVAQPAGDYGEFVETQAQLIRDQFGDARVRRRPAQLFVRQPLTDSVAALSRLIRPVRAGAYDEASSPRGLADDVMAVNLAVMRKLADEIRDSGAQLVVLDGSEFFGATSPAFSSEVKALCARESLGYIALSQPWRLAESNGIATRWRHDRHLNETGNDILAVAMDRWLAENVRRGPLAERPRLHRRTSMEPMRPQMLEIPSGWMRS